MGITESAELDISDQNLTSLELSALESHRSPSSLQRIYARRNRLTTLPHSLSLFSNLSEISLHDNALSEFPTVLCGLTGLLKVSLGYNQITSIPSEISQLTRLQLLSVAGNCISVIPREVCTLTNLVSLDMQRNLIETVPAELFQLRKLETLLLQKNNILVFPLEATHQLFALKTLNLGFNLLSSLPDMNGLSSLEELCVCSNKLTQLAPLFFVPLKSLKSFDAHTNSLSQLPDMTHAQLLKRLNLAINRLTCLPASISVLHQLEWLNLNDNLLTSLPSQIRHLTSLKKLGIVQNLLESLPNEIALLSKLSKIDVRRNRISAFPSTIRYMKSLSSLICDDNPLMTQPGIVEGKADKGLVGLGELCARSLWATTWNQQLHKHALLNTRPQPLETLEPPIYAPLQTPTSLPDFIESLPIPDRLKTYLSQPSLCNFCLLPYCQESTQLITLVSLPNLLTKQEVPLRNLFCTRECCRKYEQASSIHAAGNGAASAKSRFLWSLGAGQKAGSGRPRTELWFDYISASPNASNPREADNNSLPTRWLSLSISTSNSGQREGAIEARRTLET